MLPAMIVAKLTGGIAAVAVALLLTRKPKTSIDKNGQNGL
jgi:ethanolamine transporter EutH